MLPPLGISRSISSANTFNYRFMSGHLSLVILPVDGAHQGIPHSSGWWSTSMKITTFVVCLKLNMQKSEQEITKSIISKGLL